METTLDGTTKHLTKLKNFSLLRRINVLFILTCMGLLVYVLVFNKFDVTTSEIRDTQCQCEKDKQVNQATSSTATFPPSPTATTRQNTRAHSTASTVRSKETTATTSTTTSTTAMSTTTTSVPTTTTPTPESTSSHVTTSAVSPTTTSTTSTPSSTTTLPEHTYPQILKIECRKNSIFNIPNIIHHIWFGGAREMKTYHYLSLRSAALIQRPDTVYIYIDEAEPTGPLWDMYKAEVSCLTIRRMEAPKSIFNHTIRVVEHRADVARLEILMQYGGIYLDTDTVMVKPFDPLLNYELVLGEEIPNAYGNGIILARKNSSFLSYWHDSYKTFNDSHWAEHSVLMPPRIEREHPEFPLHVEKRSFLRPNWADGMKWFEKLNYNISENYCVHLYARLMTKVTLALNAEEVTQLNATYGALARIALYGNPTLLN